MSSESSPPPEANPPVRRHPLPREPLAFVWASVRMGWRWLTRMRTALYLLGALGLLTLLATVAPQEPNVPSTVARWRAGQAGPGTQVSALIDAVGGYDVYGSALFLALLMLLFISLTACLIPRWRGWWRLARRSQPPRTRYLDDQERLLRLTSERPPDEVVPAVRELLSGRRWRVRDDDGEQADVPSGAPRGQVAAEKGHLLREGGSLVFHTSFYLLLIGIVAGQLFGFTAQIGVVEGEPGFTDAAVSYSTWSYDPGRLWSSDDHPGFRLALDDFEVDWHDPAMGGQPKRFVSEVTITQPDGSIREAEIRPNVPLIAQGLRIHQLDWGYAPRVVVRAGGEVVHDGFLQLRRSEEGTFWTGAVKAPAAEPGVGLEVLFWPYAPPDGSGRPQLTGAPWAEAPLLFFRTWRGDLRLERSQDVNELDTTAMRPVGPGALRPGEEFAVATDDGEVTVSFPELRQWSGLQVSNKPTLGLLLLAGGLVLAGLIPSLYAYRRRLWVQADPDPETGGSLITVAGRAFQRPEAFEAEFDELVEAVREATGAGPVAGERSTPETVAAP